MAEQARTLNDVLGDEAGLLEAGAWLHDIGYSPTLREYSADLPVTGFHPLDGARYLRLIDVDEALCSLVAYHSGATVEAQERGLLEELVGAFEAPPAHLLEAITYADMTTGPDGTHLPVERRLSEILERYSPDDLVHRSITRSSPELTAAVRAVEKRLAKVG
ncbi:HD domain-containing protein [Nocardiopsis suaedae]|uniref:HD domain-containing protein n=1 Tax=Nocardiopsis suaedae TaxID=3018444 RepID=A0ABT4TK00_9ACTN|nr:HD domain-containing protein [Nocardiopsis suaedae]MDA2804589.1 HD domain-containing protein [Nocardiopsis suaedae]